MIKGGCIPKVTRFQLLFEKIKPDEQPGLYWGGTS